MAPLEGGEDGEISVQIIHKAQPTPVPASAIGGR
jgi:hypothetical protein